MGCLAHRYIQPGEQALIRNSISALLMPVLLVFSTATLSESNRWYGKEQVRQGKPLFAENCAVCHGKNAESVPDWRKRDANGNYVPPPLNGTAHAWHHSLKILRNTIRKGGKPVGGVMPAFEDKLTADEIDSIIAWFQSLWTDEIYAMWEQRNADAGFVSVKNAKKQERPITGLLKQRLKGADIGAPEPTPLKNIYQARVGADYAYLSDDGRYALIGELVDLKTGRNLTEDSKSLNRASLIGAFAESDMTIFPASGNSEHTVTILTDTDCPFCQKLHKELPEILDAGITVRYIPFPRNGSKGKGYADLKSVWCAGDRQAAMNIATGIKQGKLPSGDCTAASAVDKGFQLGTKIGLRGTPAIILSNGQMIEGYLPAKQLAQLVRTAS